MNAASEVKNTAKRVWVKFHLALEGHLKKEPVAIIAIIVTILLVPWSVSLTQKYEERTREEERLAQSQVLAATETFYFVPQTKVNVDTIRNGANCWGSSASMRKDAFRCSVGNRLYEPCFHNSSVGYVDCPTGPANHNIFTVETIKNMEGGTYRENEGQFPWYLVLENGTGCMFLTGGTAAVLNGRLDYVCSDSMELSLPIDDEEQVFTIVCANKEKERLERCRIREVWY